MTLQSQPKFQFFKSFYNTVWFQHLVVPGSERFRNMVALDFSGGSLKIQDYSKPGNRTAPSHFELPLTSFSPHLAAPRRTAQL
jgi:hypothetical protein